MPVRAPVHRLRPLPVKRHGADTDKPWSRATPQERLRGRKLQERRVALFARDPLCAECRKANPPRLRLATERDHIVPLAEGGADDESNEQGLCKACHRAKTSREAARGRARAARHPSA